jgi:hypothetical protein
MLVQSTWELPVYQVLGPIIRVHWDYSSRIIESESEDGEPQEPTYQWSCREAVVPIDADRATFEQIINAAGGPGEALADGWFR